MNPAPIHKFQEVPRSISFPRVRDFFVCHQLAACNTHLIIALDYQPTTHFRMLHSNKKVHLIIALDYQPTTHFRMLHSNKKVHLIFLTKHKCLHSEVTDWFEPPMNCDTSSLRSIKHNLGGQWPRRNIHMNCCELLLRHWAPKNAMALWTWVMIPGRILNGRAFFWK
jgi:hypothetical protein